MIVFIEEGF